jgi:predicted MFS family arabinose efflux permease
MAPQAVPGLRGVQWSLLAGNFAIGCGVMVTAGSMNDLVQSLQVSVGVGGQLITVGALVVGLGAPLLATWVAGHDRRRLLTFWLLWFGLGHLASALAPGYTALAVLRAATMLGAAVFTPQAAAAINVMAPPAQRGQAMTFIFLGWSLSSVLGMPLHAYVAEAAGWRAAFALVGVLSLLATVLVWRTVPDGVRAAPLSLAAWGQVLGSPLLMAMVAVTVTSAAGQFTLFAYLAPYYRQVLGAGPGAVSGLFMLFGAFGLLGNLLLSRYIDRLGAARGVALALAGMALSLLLWPLAGTLAAAAVVMLPWALGCFSSNSAQQVRLGQAAPALAPALMALNSSAMYLGQAIGAGGGGLLVQAQGFGALAPVGLAWLVLALGLSLWVGQRTPAPAAVAHG